MKDLITNEKHLLPRSVDFVLIFHSLFLFLKKYFLCYNSLQLEPFCVCVCACMCVCAGQKNITNLKRKRMGTVFGTWLWRGCIMIWERLSKWRKLGGSSSRKAAAMWVGSARVSAHPVLPVIPWPWFRDFTALWSKRADMFTAKLSSAKIILGWGLPSDW